MRGVTLLFSIFTLVSFLVLTFAQVGDEPSPLKEKDKEVLVHFKKVLWPKAYREHNQNLLMTLLSPKFVLIDHEGNWTGKNDELAYLGKKMPFPNEFNYHIRRLDIFENGTAIVAGVGEIRGNDEQGAFVFTYHSSNVLIKIDGKWQAVASHTSGYERVSAESYSGLLQTNYQ